MIEALILGLGNIGLKYDLEGPGETIMTHTRACQVHPRVTLIGGIDPNKEARRVFEQVTGRPAYASINASRVRPGQVDLVIVSTPTKERIQVFKDCAALRPKAILMEKPLADNYQDGMTIVETCSQENILLSVNYFRRFDKVVSQIGERIRRGWLGSPCFANCYYSGGLFENGSHYIDLFLDWFGIPSGIGRGVEHKGQTGHPATLSFFLDYGNFRACFQEINAEYGLGEIDLFFEKGRIRFREYCEHFEVMKTGADPIFPTYRRLVSAEDRELQPDLMRYQYQVLNGIVAAILKGFPIPSSGKSALSVLKICTDVLYGG